MSIEHRLGIEMTVTQTDSDGNIVSTSTPPLSDGQVTVFRECCDECFAETGCADGPDCGNGKTCAMYNDRLFRGGDAPC